MGQMHLAILANPSFWRLYPRLFPETPLPTWNLTPFRTREPVFAVIVTQGWKST
jgi:hypothetical protein